MFAGIALAKCVTTGRNYFADYKQRRGMSGIDHSQSALFHIQDGDDKCDESIVRDRIQQQVVQLAKGIGQFRGTGQTEACRSCEMRASSSR